METDMLSAQSLLNGPFTRNYARVDGMVSKENC